MTAKASQGRTPRGRPHGRKDRSSPLPACRSYRDGPFAGWGVIEMATETAAASGVPGYRSVGEVLGMIESALRFLAGVDVTQLPGETLAEVLTSMEHVDSAQAAVRGRTVTVFNDKHIQHEYAYRPVPGWLVGYTRVPPRESGPGPPPGVPAHGAPGADRGPGGDRRGDRPGLRPGRPRVLPAPDPARQRDRRAAGRDPRREVAGAGCGGSQGDPVPDPVRGQRPVPDVPGPGL